MSESLQTQHEDNNNDQTSDKISSIEYVLNKTSTDSESPVISNMVIANSDLEMTITNEEKKLSCYIMNGVSCENLNGSTNDKVNSSQNEVTVSVEGNKSNKYLGKFRCLKNNEMPELNRTDNINHSDIIHSAVNGVAELNLNGDVNLNNSSSPSDENSKQSKESTTKTKNHYKNKKKKKGNTENGIETRRRSARLKNASKELSDNDDSNSTERVLKDGNINGKHKSKKEKSKNKSKHKGKEKSKSKKSKHEKTKKEKPDSTHGASLLLLNSNTQACDNNSTVQVIPEKVKSRWRRNSEMGQDLENGHLTNDNMTNSEESTLNDVSSFNVSPTDAMPEFQSITENMFLFERKKDELKKKLKEAKLMLCDCILTKEERNRGLMGCGDDCLNRMLMIECGSRCPLGDHCSNKRFQQKLYAPVEPFKTIKKGWGLRTLEALPPYTFIMEYVGEVIDPFMFHKRVEKYAKQKLEHYYFMALKSDEIIDATIKGNVTRFINHSCEPNSITQKWTVNGELRIGFFTIKQVNAGEEITFDYQFQRYGKKAQRCFCESTNCRGWIGSTENNADILTDGSKISKGQMKEEELVEYDSDNELNPDVSLEEETDYLLSKGGIRNRQEMILTSRLMVQAEKCHLRLKLIDVLMNTFVMAYLRLFIDYHGLKLIWIWMMEAEDIELKARILHLLEVLPIPNKTMLTDSKVYQMVEKWSQKDSPESQQFLNLNDEPNKEKNDETKSENEKLDIESKTYLNEEIFDKSEVNENNSISQQEDEISSQKKSPDSNRKVELSKLSGKVVIKSKTKGNDSTLTPTKSRENVSIGFLAQKLLSHWKDLKEVFRIPRLERQKRHDDEAEADRKTKENEERVSKGLSVIQEQRVIDDKDYTIAGILGNKRRCLKSLTERDPQLPRFAPVQVAPILPKLTKEEHRKMFEYNVAKSDYNEALKKYQEDLALYNEYKEQVIQQFQMQSMNNAENQAGVNEFYAPFSNDVGTHRVIDSYLYPSIANGHNSMAYIDQSNCSVYGDSFIDPNSDLMNVDDPMYNEFDLTDLIPRYESPLVVLSNHATVDNSNAATHGIDNVNFSEIIYEDDTFLDSMERKMFEEMYPSEGIYYITQKGKTYFISLSGNITDEITVKENVTEPLPISFTERIPEEKLPYPWKYSTSNGHVYYYNKLKHIKQWHPPQENQIDDFDDSRIDAFENNQSDMSQPSANSSPFLISCHKKDKDKEFRAKLSQFVVKCLNPYMKKGRITNNSDFKYLARKLTHTIVEKEMKQCRSIEDLSFSESVKHKTKEYVKRYMSRYGRGYKVDSSTDKTSHSPN